MVEKINLEKVKRTCSLQGEEGRDGGSKRDKSDTRPANPKVARLPMLGKPNSLSHIMG
jgi:hypothetical protein